MKSKRTTEEQKYYKCVIFFASLFLMAAATAFSQTESANQKVVSPDITNLSISNTSGNIGMTLDMNGATDPQKRIATTTVKTTVVPRNQGKIATFSVCGDDICDRDNGEDGSTCSRDCKEVCGDSICSNIGTDICSGCPQDCGTCSCGNGKCEVDKNETCRNCSQDCGTCPIVCGNGICEAGETCANCEADCGTCAVCPDGQCNGSEDCSTCPQDCGACPPPPSCGDGVCDPFYCPPCTKLKNPCRLPCLPAETCDTCPQDCGSCGTCFLKGTPVTLADGSTKSIEKIKKGDLILSFDDATKQLKPDRVTKILKHASDGYLIINGHLKVTGNHPVLSKGDWIPIGRLKTGDSLINSKGEVEIIRSKAWIPGKVKTYNMEVNPYHSYIAGGYVVHNGGGGIGKGQ